MALNYLKARLKNRIDTASNWENANPTLLKGEIGIESDTGYVKAGDGSTAWNNLGYLSAPGLDIPETDLSNYVTLNSTQTITGTKTFSGTLDSSGDVNFSSSSNVIVPTPTAAYHAATKKYVDDSISGLHSLTTASVTIAASAWQDSQYTVTNDNIKTDSLVMLDAATGITKDEFLAIANAAIFCVSQSDGQIILQAAGTVPTVDINIALAIF